MAIKHVLLICFAVVLGISLAAADEDPFVERGMGQQSEPDPWNGNDEPDPWNGNDEPDPWNENNGQDYPNDQSEMYSFEISESSGSLIDEEYSNQYTKASNGMALDWTPGTSQNIFWIVSRSGDRHTRSIDIPLNSYARALIIPAASGQLLLEEQYPNGRVREYNLGRVTAGRQYRIWFFADSRGTHFGRYRVNNGPYSDTLTHRVT